MHIITNQTNSELVCSSKTPYKKKIIDFFLLSLLCIYVYEIFKQNYPFCITNVDIFPRPLS